MPVIIYEIAYDPTITSILFNISIIN